MQGEKIRNQDVLFWKRKKGPTTFKGTNEIYLEGEMSTIITKFYKYAIITNTTRDSL